MIELLVVIAVLAAVVAVVGAPLRRGELEQEQRREAAQLAELEAAKEAKYREIRDAELDHRTGKLDSADWRALDRTLRAEAIELLRQIDAIGPLGDGAEGRERARGVDDERPRPEAPRVG